MLGRTSIGLGLALALGLVAVAQTVREKPLDDLPAVDRGAGPPARTATNPPPPPPVPRAPGMTTRAAPPPADAGRDIDAEDEPPARATPDGREAAPPARTYDPPPARRVDRAPAPPPTRAYTPPPARSAFAANCTQQCHLACEAAFEACNGDDSPARPDCVRKLEACRVQRCSCRMD